MPVSNETQNSEELTEQDWLEILAPLSDEDAALLDTAMSRPLEPSLVALGEAHREAELARMGISIDDDIETVAEHYLPSCDAKTRRAILAEARRLRERRSSIPWYKEEERLCGQRLWLQLAMSYQGDE